MPGLDRHGDDVLLATIADLRRRVSELSGLRRRPSPGCELVGGGGVALGVGFNIIGLDSVEYATAGWADALPAVTFPVAGVYLVVVTVPATSGASQTWVVSFGAASWNLISSPTAQQTLTTMRRFDAGDTANLGATPLGGTTTPAMDWRVNIARLSDIPDLVS